MGDLPLQLSFPHLYYVYREQTIYTSQALIMSAPSLEYHNYKAGWIAPAHFKVSIFAREGVREEFLEEIILGGGNFSY
nr:hypothetical protein Iba_chr10fCG2640 [Ipomoea batatas]